MFKWFKDLAEDLLGDADYTRQIRNARGYAPNLTQQEQYNLIMAAGLEKHIDPEADRVDPELAQRAMHIIWDRNR